MDRGISGDMIRRLVLLLTLASVATPVAADVRFLAFNPADRTTTALTRGVTLEIERGLFGAVSVRRILSNTGRGSATITRGGPDEARRARPEGSVASVVYTILAEGDGRGLSRALCPGSAAAYLVMGGVRAGRPFTMEAVGRWPDGAWRHCVTLNYTYRGEWSLPPRANGADPD